MNYAENKPLQWTASSAEMFRTCPYKYYRQRVLRDVKDTLSEQAQWGIKVHKSFEDAVNYGAPLPEGCRQWQPLADKIKLLPGEKLPEYRFSISEAYLPDTWGNAWCRGQADLVVRHGSTAVVFDYKTGKRKPSDQLALYAGFAFSYWPELQTVHTAYVWLRDKQFDRHKYERKDVPEIWSLWLPTIQRMKRSYEKNDWPKQPCGLCRKWCPVRDCPFNGEE